MAVGNCSNRHGRCPRTRLLAGSRPSVWPGSHWPEAGDTRLTWSSYGNGPKADVAYAIRVAQAWVTGGRKRSRTTGRSHPGHRRWRRTRLLAGNRDPDTVRAPDVAWFAPGRLARGRRGYPQMAPDLAMMQRFLPKSSSPTQFRWPEMAAKSRPDVVMLPGRSKQMGW